MDKQSIEKYFKQTDRFMGVFAMDTFPPALPTFTGAVLNLDSSTGPGSHWVGIYMSTTLEYFDPLGHRPPIGLAYPGPIRYNKKRIQHEASISCGLFSVDFVKRRLAGEQFTSIIQSYLRNRLLNDLLQ